MTLKKMLSLTTVLSIFSALMAVPSHAANDDKYDIVGIRLGMTYKQVKEALLAHDILESDIQEMNQFYHYSDGVKNNYRTDDFLLRITAGKLMPQNQSQDSFRIYFSPPPEDGRVVAVVRNVKNQIDPPTNEQYRNAVYTKYGSPTVAHKNANVSQWMFGEGAMNCLETSLHTPITLPVKYSGGGDSPIILEKVFRTAGSKILTDRFRNSRVKDLKECANILQYSIHGYGLGSNRPFTAASVIMIDVQSWVRAELAAGAMVESLRQEAIKKRESRGTKPIL